MRFFTPIFQGVIILLIVAILGAGVKAYAYFENFDVRIQAVEKQIEKITNKFEQVPLCRN